MRRSLLCLLLLFLCSSSIELAGYLIITFDDCYRSQYEAALLLNREGLKAVFFCPTGLIGKGFEGYELMSFEELEKLIGLGHEIGSHSFSHLNATTADERVIEREAKESKEVLEEELGIEVIAFAYPYGIVEPWKEHVSRHYRFARGSTWGINELPLFDPHELFSLPLSETNFHLLKSYLKELDRCDLLILMIHRVAEDPRREIDLSESNFLQLIREMELSRARVIGFEELGFYNEICSRWRG